LGSISNMKLKKSTLTMACFLFYTIGRLCLAEPLLVPSPETYTRDYAVKFTKISNTILAPVYAPLAQQIVSEFGLAEKSGIGIDLGSGPGNLIIELCKLTKQMHWIDADINPYFFPIFTETANNAGFGHRVSAIFADAQLLPFRDNYAEIIVSRGSFHFWQDKRKAFSEIYRVLKPGGVAFIGRGFPDNLPLETAKRIREAQQGGDGKPSYDVGKTANELRDIMKALDIKDFSIRIPVSPEPEVSYGVWVEFRKSG